MKTMFAKTQTELPGWFWAGPSAGLKAGRIRALSLEGQGVVLWRNAQGQVVAMDRRCAHLGADLSQGTVSAEGLRCPFHHWCYDSLGRCRSAPAMNTPPDRRLPVFPVLERWKHLWVFLGPEPLFPMPECQEEGMRVVHVGPVPMKCHPQICLANGIDGQHFRALHNLEFPTEPRYEFPDSYSVINHMQARLPDSWMRRLVGTHGQVLVAAFRTYGANLGWLNVTVGKRRFGVLFNGHMRPGGHTANHMFFFLFRPWAPNLRLMLTLLPLLFSDDQKTLEAMSFAPGFVAGIDDGLIGLAAVVDRLVAGSSDRHGQAQRLGAPLENC